MKAVEFEEVNVRIAEHQDEYETLPSYCNVQEGTAMFCFELDEDEKYQVYTSGKIFMKMFTGNKPLQPIAMSCVKDDLYIEMEEDEIPTK